jgi:phosphoenolpyruvate-protein kinase (PTS system EI component)
VGASGERTEAAVPGGAGVTPRPAGKGTPTWTGEAHEGTVREVRTAQDVLALLDDAPEDLIVLMHTAGATTLSPLFADISGIVCTTGTEGSHVAILSRDFGIPCIVGAQLTTTDLDGCRIRMEPSGEVSVLDG